MIPDALLALQRSDLAALQASPALARGRRLLFVDPGLLDEALRLGFPVDALDYRPLDVGRDFQARVTAEAMQRALRLDARLARDRERLLGDGSGQRFLGWDHVRFRFAFLRALVARRLGELCDRAFPEPAVGLLRPVAAQQFYFDSFVATDLFAGGAARWRIVGHYDAVDHRVPGGEDAALDPRWLQAARAAGPADAVLHLPTVWSHRALYAREIARRFERKVELSSPFWDAPLLADRCPRVPTAQALAHVGGAGAVHAYAARARAAIAAELLDLGLAPHAAEAQADAMAAHARAQATDWLTLSAAFAGTRPHFVLTDHDTGTNGPLFTLAHALGAPVTVLPHSSYPTQPLPHAERVVAVERDGFGSPVRTVCGEPVATRAFLAGPRVAAPARTRVRTVCLLTNTFESRGIAHVDLAGFVRFFAALREACTVRGVALSLRAKPGGACPRVLAPATGLSERELAVGLEEPLPALAARTDACLAYGELTSAAIDFLDAGAWVGHVSEERRPNDLVNASALSTMRTLPSVDGAAALATLSAWLDDDAAFARAAAVQRAEYAARLVATGDRIFD